MGYGMWRRLTPWRLLASIPEETIAVVQSSTLSIVVSGEATESITSDPAGGESLDKSDSVETLGDI
jgi:hypothetical protein